MDIISFNEAATANGRIEKFIENPDSNSGIVTVPKVIGAGESVTVPAGRVAVLPNVQIDGTLNVEGEVFIPAGTTLDKVVEVTGNQNIDGIKTFSSSPIVPTPTTGTQVVNKTYADTKQSKSELAYDISTSSFIPNTLTSGAIIERGSNANGEYAKFADGTLICNVLLPNENGYSWPIGTWFQQSNFPFKTNGWTYPSAFSAVPSVHISSLNDDGSSGKIEGILTTYYATSATKALFDGKATTNISRILYIRLMAIGRWK